VWYSHLALGLWFLGKGSVNGLGGMGVSKFPAINCGSSCDNDIGNTENLLGVLAAG
jgi:hypothetical protein